MELTTSLSLRQALDSRQKTVKKLFTQAWALICLIMLSTWNVTYAGGSVDIVDPEITGNYVANFRADRRNISVIEYDGNYDRDNFEARMVVAREFYKEHPDNFDFLMVFSSFEFETGDALAFHQTVQNDIEGLGKSIYDSSSFYGSSGQLKGYTDMAALSRYRSLDPLDPNFEQVLAVMSHEVLHQWGSRNKFIDELGNFNEDLVDGEGHWISNFDLGGSVHHVPEWLDNGDGTYTANPDSSFRRSNRFSPLDLYNMGVYAASEVPPMQLLKLDTPLTKGVTPGTTITATPVTVTIEQLIAANGPRVPSVADSQKTFRMGFIYLTKPGEEVTEDVYTKINDVRDNFEQRFSILTGGRAIAQVYPEGVSGEEIGTPDVISGGEIRTSPPEITEGLAWLESQQGQDGSWFDKDNTQLRDTSVILSLFSQIDQGNPSLTAAIEWLTNADANTADHLARKIIGLEATGNAVPQLRQELYQLQNQDGGWGITDDYSSDILDTALALRALHDNEAQQTANGIAYLNSVRNADGAWGFVVDGESNVYATTEVLRAFAAAGRKDEIDAQTTAWVIAQRNADGGYGDTTSTSVDTANVILAFIEIDQLDLIDPSTASFYLSQQQDNLGSWSGSVYATALSASAFQNANFANLTIPDSITARPMQAYDGDTLRLDWEITNNSGQTSTATIARLFLGNPATGGTQIGDDLSIPAIGPGSGISITSYWDSLGETGPKNIFFIIDPDNTVPETNESDNLRIFEVDVAAAPAEVDLSISDNDMAIIPQSPNRLPINVGFMATVRNNGLTNADNAVVRLVKVSNGQTEFIEDKIFNILNRSSIAVNFTYNLVDSGESVFQIILDPEESILEANENNNVATGSLNTSPSVDLEVNIADIQLSEEPGIINKDITFSVMLHNYGTSQSPSATVNYIISDGTNARTIQSNAISIGAGQSVQQDITWRIDTLGDLSLSVQIDPDNQIAETLEDNNVATRSFTSSTLEGINLTVSFEDFIANPNPLAEGASANISALVFNQGTVDANNVSVRIYRGDPANQGILIGEDIIANIPSGGSATANVIWPRVDVRAEQLLFVVVDEANTIVEFSEDDNSAFNIVPVVSLPDFALSSADTTLMPSLPVPGDTVSVKVNVTNLGMQAGTTNIALYDQAYTATAIPVITQAVTVPMQVSKVVEFTWEYQADSSVAQLSLVADPANLVPEINEGNNSAEIFIPTQNSDFYVTERFISPNDDGVQDQTVFFFNTTDLINSVYVVDTELNIVIKTFTVDLPAISGSVVWDGRDEDERIVGDGEYLITTSSDFNNLENGSLTIVDTNRSPVLDADGTQYGVHTNYTCKLPGNSDYAITPDDKQLFIAARKPSDPNDFDFGSGLYKLDEFGTIERTLIPESFFAENGQLPYDYGVSNVITNDNGDIVYAYTYSRTVRFGQEIVKHLLVNGDGTNLREIDVSSVSTRVDFLSFSNDGAVLYAYDRINKRLISFNTVNPEIVTDIYVSADVQFDLGNINVSPNNRYIVFVEEVDTNYNSIGLVKVYDTVNNTTKPLFNTFDDITSTSEVEIAGSIEGIYWSPDSSKIAFEYAEQEQDGGGLSFPGLPDTTGNEAIPVRHADIYKVTGERIIEINGGGAQTANRLVWSSTGEEILFQQDTQIVDEYCSCVAASKYFALNVNTQHLSALGETEFKVFDSKIQAGKIQSNNVSTKSQKHNSENNLLQLSNGENFIWAPSERKIITNGYNKTIYDIPSIEAGLVGSTDAEDKVLLSEELFPDYRDIVHSRFNQSELYLHGTSPTRKRLIYTTSTKSNECSFDGRSSGELWSFYSLENLTVDLRVLRSASAGGILIKGSAVDKQFAQYNLEYAYFEDQSTWFRIQPAQSDIVIDDDFTTWVPPQAGTFLVRLTVTDKAGNESNKIKRVNWNENPSITDLYREPPFFSPNGDSVNDTVDIHYRVLEPVHLEFEILNSAGELVDSFARDHVEIGQEFNFAWDGRTSTGVQLEDGEYVIRIQGNEFRVFLDRTAPVIDANYLGAYLKGFKTDGFADDEKRSPAEYGFTANIKLQEDEYQSLSLEKAQIGSNTWELVSFIDVFNPLPINVSVREFNFNLLDANAYQYRFIAMDKAGNETITTPYSFSSQAVITSQYAVEKLNSGVTVVPDYITSTFRVPYIEQLSAGEYQDAAVPILPYSIEDKFGIFTVNYNSAEEIIDYAVEYKSTLDGTWQVISDAHLVSSLNLIGNNPETGTLTIGSETQQIQPKTLQIAFARAETFLSDFNLLRVKLTDALGNELITNPTSMAKGAESDLDFQGLMEKTRNILYGNVGTNTDFSQIIITLQSDTDPNFALPRELIQKAFYPSILEPYQIATDQLRDCTGYTGFATGISITGEEITSREASFSTPCNQILAEVAYPLAQTANIFPTQSPYLLLSAQSLVASGSGDIYKLLEVYLQEEDTTNSMLIANIVAPLQSTVYEIDLSPFIGDFTESTELTIRLIDNDDQITETTVFVEVPDGPVEFNVAIPQNNSRVCAVSIDNEDTGNKQIVVDLETEIRNADSGVLYSNYLLDPITGDVVDELVDIYDHTGNDYSLSRALCNVSVEGMFACGQELKDEQGKKIGSAWPIPGVLHKMRFEDLDKDVSILTEIYNKSGVKVTNKHNFYVDGSVEFSNHYIDQEAFSPDSDGKFDELVLSFDLGEATIVTASVHPIDDKGKMLDSIGDIFTEQQYFVGTNSYIWDGHLTSGVIPEDGKYAIVFTVVDGCGLELITNKPPSDEEQNVGLPFSIDTTAPVLSLFNPMPAQLVSLVVPMGGVIDDLNFKNYTIEYGLGLTPSEWVFIDQGVNTVTDGNVTPGPGLITNWNTYGLVGDVTLRLSANDNVGHLSQILVPVKIGQTENLLLYIDPVPSLFSANGDGRRDTLAIRYGLDRAVNTTIEIKEISSGTVVRTLKNLAPETAGDKIVQWNGLNEAGLLAADGFYEVKIEVIQSDNEFVTQTEFAQIELDSTSPEVEFTSPSTFTNGFIKGTETLVGSLQDKNLLNYSVSIGDSNGSNFEDLQIGTTSVLNSELGLLQGVQDGEYKIKVSASDTAENQTLFLKDIVVDNTKPELKIISPETNAQFGIEDNVLTILALQADLHIDNYSIRYGLGNAPTEWNILIEEQVTESSEVESVFNIANLIDGEYTIEYSLRDKANNETIVYTRFIIDRTAPIVEFQTPEADSYINSPTDIKLSLIEDNLLTYELSFANVASDQSIVLLTGEGVKNEVLDYNWFDLPVDGEYVLKIYAKDKAGNESLATRKVIVDLTPPEPPINVVGGYQDPNGIAVNWQMNTETDLAGYTIYRDDVKITNSLITDISYLDDINEERDYVYYVTASDKAGNESEKSELLKLTIDLSAPEVRIFRPATNSILSGQVEIIGTASSSDDFKEFRVTAINSADQNSIISLGRSTVPVIGGELTQWNTLGVPEDESYIIRLEAEDFNGNVAAKEISVSIDNTPPAAPTGLALEVLQDDITLDWNANTETDIKGYLIFRNERIANATGIVLGDIDKFAIESNNYSDLNLADGEYNYYLLAVDEAGNFSEPSLIETGTIDLRAPKAEIVIPLDGVEFDKPLFVKATAEDLDIAEVRFEYAAAASPTVWTVFDTFTDVSSYDATFNPAEEGPLEFGVYLLRAVATDKTGNVDPAPSSISVNYMDITNPDQVSGLSSLVNAGDVTLTWEAVIDADLSGYHIYRSNGQDVQTRISTTPVVDTTFIDTDLIDASYRYSVSAIDGTGNESELSETTNAIVFTPNVIQPFSPILETESTLTGTSLVDGTLFISLSNVNGEISQPVAQVTANESFNYVLSNLPLGENTATIHIEDEFTNISKTVSRIVTVVTSPDAPTGLAASDSITQIDLDWNDNTESDIFGYLVYRDGNILFDETVTPFDTIIVPDNQSLVPNLTDGLSYTDWRPLNLRDNTPFAGVNVDLKWSEPKLVTSLNIQWLNERTRPSKYSVEAIYNGVWVPLASIEKIVGVEDEIIFEKPYVTDTLRLVVEEIQRVTFFPLRLAEVSAKTQSIVNVSSAVDLTINGAYSYTVSAVSKNSFESLQSESAQVEIGDIEAPSISALTASVVSSDVTLQWAATIATDFASYMLYRDGELISEITSIDQLSFVDAGLVNGDYNYELIVADVVGNNSDTSTANASVDIALLSAPQNLIATAQNTGNAIDLNWLAPEVGEASSYQLMRATQANGPYENLATTSELEYTDDTVEAEVIYYYVLVALDAVNNLSSNSNEASAATFDTASPEAPVIYWPTVSSNPIDSSSNEIAVYGTSEPGSVISLYKENQFYGNTITSSNVNAVSLPSNLFENQQVYLYSPDGAYHLNRNYDDNIYRITNLNDLSEERHNYVTQEMDAGNYRNLGFNKASNKFYYHYFVGGFLNSQSVVGEYNLLTREHKDIWVAPIDFNIYSSGRYTTVTENHIYTPGQNASGSGLFRVNIESGAIDLIHEGIVSNYRAPQISDDGSKLAIVQSSSVALVDVSNGQNRLIYTFENTSISASVYPFSLSSDKFFFTRYNSLVSSYQAYVYDFSSGVIMQVLSEGRVSNDGFSWSATGKEIVYFDYLNDSIWSYDLTNQVSENLISFNVNAGINWLQNGQAIYSTYSCNISFCGSMYSKVTLPGTFTYPIVELEPGENIFTAVSADTSNNVSLSSSSISVTYADPVGIDLAVTVSDIKISPSSIIIGDDARISVQIRNEGISVSDPAQFRLVMLKPDGTQETLRELSLPAISGQSSVYQYYDLNSLSDLGKYKFIVEVDGPNAVKEINENNNFAIQDFNVLSDLDPITDLNLNSTQLVAGQTLTGNFEIFNPGALTEGVLSVRIEDLDGYLVEELQNTAVLLDANSTINTPVTWNSTGILDGTYVVVGALTSIGGSQVISESSQEFELVSITEFVTSIETDQATYASYSTVKISSTITYTLGNQIINDSLAEIRVHDSEGNELDYQGFPIASLTPGQVLEFNASWNTGLSDNGQYTATLTFTTNGAISRTTQSSFTINESLENTITNLTGDLSLTNSYVKYKDAVLGVDIENNGNHAISNLQAELIITNAGLLVAKEEILVNVDSGSSFSGNYNFNTDAWALGDYQAELKLISPNTSLSRKQFTLRDRTLPTVSLVAPAFGAIISNTNELILSATDADSNIDFVEISFDAGTTWTQLETFNSAESTYILALNTFVDSSYTAIARSQDTQGNISNSINISFEIDTIAPAIEIIGVEDATHYQQAVQIAVAIADKNIATSIIQIDGIALESTNSITVTEEGEHTVSIYATDSAGNVSVRSLAFTIDSSKPLITISGVADQVYYNTDIQAQISIRDNNLLSSSVILDGTLVQSIPVNISEEGMHILVVEAQDIAGNLATESISFTIDKTVPVINIAGVTDGERYTQAVTPAITITDDNLSEQVQTLNGEDYISNTVISDAGNYVLVVSATDAAGNTTVSTIEFEIEIAKPTLSVTSPVDFSEVDTEVVSISGVATLDSTITIQSSDGAIYTTAADGNGIFAIESIPLQVGDNLFSIVAENAQGTKSDVIELHVIRTKKQNVEITYQLTQPERVLILTANNVIHAGDDDDDDHDEDDDDDHDEDDDEDDDDDHDEDDDDHQHWHGCGHSYGYGHNYDYGYGYGYGYGRNRNYECNSTNNKTADLLALLTASLEAQDKEYDIVSTRTEFYKELRSRKHSLLIMLDTDDEKSRHCRRNHTNNFKYIFNHQLEKELKATVASGLNVLTIKNKSGKFVSTESLFGIKERGNKRVHNLHMKPSQTLLPEGDYSYSGRAMLLENRGADILATTHYRSRPAITHNSYGQANTMYFAFNPVDLHDMDAAYDLIFNSTNYLLSNIKNTDKLLPNQIIGISWSVSGLNIGDNYKLVQDLGDNLSFESANNSGQLVDPQTIQWDFIADKEDKNFTAYVKLPNTAGNFDSNVVLSNFESGIENEVNSKEISLALEHSTRALANQFIYTLYNAPTSHWHNKRKWLVKFYVYKALKQNTRKRSHIDRSLRYLLEAYKHVERLPSNNDVLKKELADLICIYQRLWHEKISDYYYFNKAEYKEIDEEIEQEILNDNIQ